MICIVIFWISHIIFFTILKVLRVKPEANLLRHLSSNSLRQTLPLIYLTRYHCPRIALRLVVLAMKQEGFVAAVNKNADNVKFLIKIDYFCARNHTYTVCTMEGIA